MKTKRRLASENARLRADVKRLAAFRDAVFATLDADSAEGFDLDADTTAPTDERRHGFTAAMALATIAVKLLSFLSPRGRRERENAIIAKAGDP